MKKTFTFTSSLGGILHMIPDESTVDAGDVIRNSINGVKTIRNAFEINFASGFWTTKSVTQANIIRNSHIYGSLIFEVDSKGNDITKDIINGIESTDTVDESYNPYAALPKSVLGKLSVKELTDACESLHLEIVADASKAELISILSGDNISDATVA